MGSGISSVISKSDKKASTIHGLAKEITPSYFIDNVILNADEISLISTTWGQLAAGVSTAPYRERMIRSPADFEYGSAFDWFLDAYTNRLYEISCDSIPTASGNSFLPGVVLERLISCSVSVLTQPEELGDILRGQANVNHTGGIKASYYGFMGRALFWALEVVIGDTFDSKATKVWIRFYSSLLKILLITATELDVDNTEKINNDIHPAVDNCSSSNNNKNTFSIRRILSSEKISRMYKVISGEQGEEDSVKLHMKRCQPAYFVEDVVLTEQDVKLASKAWWLLMSGENTEPFNRKKAEDEEFHYSSSLTWFYDAFYGHFFKVCPQAQPLFANVSIVSQGKLIAGLISSALESVCDSDKIKDRMRSIAVKHSTRGIRAEQYGLLGVALLYALELVVGEAFDAETKIAWTRLYSHLLNIILPVVSAYEVKRQQELSSKISSGKYMSNMLSGENSMMSMSRKKEKETDKIYKVKEEDVVVSSSHIDNERDRLMERGSGGGGVEQT
eukprot:gene11672-24449_t